MKTITKALAFAAFMFTGAATADAQCIASFTSSQTVNNVVNFTNTSQPIIPNSSNFFWDFGDGNYDYTQNPTHTYSAPGPYIVCLNFYDSLSTCSAYFCDSITVFGNVLCNVTTSASVTQQASCSNCADGAAYAMMYGGTGPYTYSWSSGGTSALETGLAPGTYIVCITDANGCSACDTVTVNFSSCAASFTWSQTNPNEIDFVSTSTGTSPQTGYYWNFGDNTVSYSNSTTANHFYNIPGTYTVCLFIYDSLNFCSSSFCDTVTVTGTPVPGNCTANFAIWPDSVNTNQAWGVNLSSGGPGMAYQWYWGDNTPADTVPYPSHVYTSTGSYNICLIVVDVVNQCTDTMCQLLWVPRLSQTASMAPYFVNIIPQAPQSVHELQSASFSIYPNPAQNELKIKSDFALNGNNYRVLDVTGRVVISGKLTGNSIDVSEFDHGMYVLQIENKGGIASQRFMKN